MTTKLSSPNTSSTPDPSRSPVVRPAAANNDSKVSVASPISAPEQSGQKALTMPSIETPQPISNMDLIFDSNQTILVDLSSPVEDISSFDLACSTPLPSSPSPEPLVSFLPSISTEELDRVIGIDPRLIPLPSSPSSDTLIDPVGLEISDFIAVQPCLIPLPISPILEPEENAALSDPNTDSLPLDLMSSSEGLCSDSPIDPPDELSLTSSTEDDPMPSTPQSPVQILSRLVEFAQVKSPIERSTTTTTTNKKTLRKRISTHNFFGSHSSTSPNEPISPTSPTSPFDGSFPSFFGRSSFGRKVAGPSTASGALSVTGTNSSQLSSQSNSTVVGFQPAIPAPTQTITHRPNPTSVLASTDPNRPKAPPSQIGPNTKRSEPIRSSSSEPHHRRPLPQTQAHPFHPRSNGAKRMSTGPSAIPLLPHPSVLMSSHPCWNTYSPTSPIGSTGYGSTSAFGFDNRAAAAATNQRRKTRDGSVGRSEVEKSIQGRRASRIFMPGESSRADWINMLEEKERSRDRSASKEGLSEKEESEQYTRAELCFMI
ncbi:hypothetical protein [Phaffia rhodozyma]|uniref:Uncharacterized protein n=1 Tax=Phaffia rhodozyma TaxID=264483 RepID=A0A0F7SSC8_PHARH|nr:hypothetical protein [Phaffia rhodozyma]